MIQQNILKIKECISLSCSKANKDSNEIIIVAVCKSRTAAEIKQVIEAGITDIGENRVQEVLIKYNELKSLNYEFRNIKWHMVGHLQTNKVKEAVRIFDLIHSVDSLHLAEEIDRQAKKINKIQDILIQVNTSGEKTKFGLKPNDTIATVKEVGRFKNINIKGLMTIAAVVDNPEETRPYFKMLREIRDKINELRVISYKLDVLSMGMTEDFKVAIEEGSNMVRIGRAIFEG